MRRFYTLKKHWDKDCLKAFESRMTDILEYIDYYKRSNIWLDSDIKSIENCREDVTIIYNGLRTKGTI